ncbi:hypothetical protein FVEN_g6891 [Fusarium venenatum]|uniref:Uncharacterized protein n=1 Tax=Fusarium venenatum TaxID=56646 RepID=A0A2L2T000_9HYPO|nr:uncharacterized protein FVRRES_00284 [Fusarium venenatum]KAG8355434.1 hypothetical protein FVEN_g6891 [Fusarium venenatum]KAH7006458.1 hypothetical protein EDB82DRAFT_473122 [Fusarium venenatum]CEI63772.1 unnamed protein product [Fusarium venenatum]
MLRRNSSRNTTRRPLSRSKSTASVARSPIRDLESIDPVKAERDANLAAVLSYYRAKDQADEKAKNVSLTRRYLETLQPPNGQCHNTQEDVVSSSSHQKVRKSRSMMVSSHASDLRPRSSPLPPTSGDEEQQLKDARPKSAALRAATSMSFLRSRRKTAASRASHIEVSDAALRLARERFQQIQEEEAKQMGSTLSRPKTRESQRSTTLRKSLRNTSNTSTAFTTFSTNSAYVSKQHVIRNTARKVSHGLRSKLRGLFGKGKSEDSQEHDPCATERDFDVESCLHVGDTEAMEEASMFQVTAHVPSLHDVPSNKKLRSRKGSVESFGDHCVSDDRSRVTSWTNSMTDTSQGTEERQRLSVIKENDFKQWPAHSTIRRVRPDDDCKGHEHERQSSISSSVTEVPDKDSNYATETTGQGYTGCDWNDDKASSDQRTVLLDELDPHKTISHRSSAFFGSPSRQSVRSPSPYRRAIREMNSSEEVNGLLGSQYLHSLSTLNLPARQYSNPGSDKDYHAIDVDSVYSFYADDVIPVPPAISPAIGSNVFEQSPDRRYTRRPSPEISIYSPANEHQRDTSTASSVEWKTWLSSKVSKLEGPTTPTRRKQETGALPPLGHLRELASMGSTPELSVTAKCTPNRSPLGSVKGNAQAFPDNSPTRLPRRAGTVYNENLAPNYEKTTDKERTPSIPRRSTLRAVPSLPSVDTRGNLMETGPKREMQRMRSMNTLGRLNSTPEETKRRSRTPGWQGSPTRSSPGINGRHR